MTPWLRTRRIWMLPLLAVICALTMAVAADRVALMPVAVGVEGQALWSTFLPLVWALGVADVFASKAQAVEVRPARRVIVADAILFIVVCLVGVSIFALAFPAHSRVGDAGHVLVLSGLAALITFRRGASAGALAVTSLMVLTTLYGIRAPLGPYVRVLQPDGEPFWALGLGVALCLGACSCILRNHSRAELETDPSRV